MFSFRNYVVQMTISLVMSALSELLREQKFKTAIVVILVAAGCVIIFAVAFAFAGRIDQRMRRGKKNNRNRRRR
jgi:hypothetical protein